ncbi:MAG: VOC family protein [Anaerolineae bacterium]|nr:VOC family protein [Anaerolineae bacterium]
MNVEPNLNTLEHVAINCTTRLGHVHYTVANLDRQIAFYRDILGFKLHWRNDASAGLGAGGKEDLLRFTELANARRTRGTTGLYHTAFLVPTRWDLAQLLKRIAETRTRIQGMSNHGTHHAIYLPDAEGNGIELAWDFPQDQWPKSFEEMLQNNRGLAPEEVFSSLDDRSAEWEGLDPATKVGHVHLHVSQLPPTKRFYYDILGFELPFDTKGVAPTSRMAQQFTESAIFFAAGSYHHHIGTNVWQGVGAPPPPADATGLRYFTIVVPNKTELDRLIERTKEAGIAVEQTADGMLVRDPAQNGMVLTSETE